MYVLFNVRIALVGVLTHVTLPCSSGSFYHYCSIVWCYLRRCLPDIGAFDTKCRQSSCRFWCGLLVKLQLCYGLWRVDAFGITKWDSVSGLATNPRPSVRRGANNLKWGAVWRTAILADCHDSGPRGFYASSSQWASTVAYNCKLLVLRWLLSDFS